MPERLSGAEFRATRELLGLTLEAIASILDVRTDTIQRWERGREPIPYRVRDELAQASAGTDTAVATLVDAMLDVPEPAIIVYTTDADLHAARPDMSHLTARWWRHVAARALRDVPGAVIIEQP